jgi:uncharacterized protein involved in outer membrane biogenesis
MKLLIKILLITFLIIATALVAAPFFVRQEQVKNFIQERVKLADNAKLVIEGNIDFGVFPYANVKIPLAKIVKTDGTEQVFEKVSVGFDTLDLIAKSIDFDFAFKNKKIYYSGNLQILDYNNFVKNGASAINLKLEKPARINLVGNLLTSATEYKFENFVITHKQTEAKGNLVAVKTVENGLQISLDSELVSENIEDLRKLTLIGTDANKSFNQLSGEGNAKLRLNTQGLNSDDFKKNLSGEGSINIDSASIYGIDINELIGAPQETKLEKTSSKKIDISDVDIRFNIENGVAKVKEFSANNQLAYLSGQGVVDIVQKALKFSVDIDAEVASARVKIPLLVSGQFDNIKFAPRVGDALIQNVDKIIGENKIQLKNIKINLDKNNLGKSVEDIKNIGKSFGIDLDKASGGVLNKIAPATQATKPNAEVAPATKKIEDVKPINVPVPASLQINSQPARQVPAN